MWLWAGCLTDVVDLPIVAVQDELDRAAGTRPPAEEYAEGPLDLHRHLIRHPAATFYVRVTGHSMTGAGILDGDLLVGGGVVRRLPSGPCRIFTTTLPPADRA